MPGYQIKLERIAIAGADDLVIRSLLDRQQFCDPLGSLVGHRRGNDMTTSDCHPLTAGFLLDGDLHGLYDLIIGSDLLYERDAKGRLAAFVGRHASPAVEAVLSSRMTHPMNFRHATAHSL